MQKYSDLKRYYHFSQTDPRVIALDQAAFAGGAAPPSLNRNTAAYAPATAAASAYGLAQPGEQTVPASTFKLFHVVLLVISLASFLYVRAEALGNKNSVFYELYKVFTTRFGELSFDFMIFPKARSTNVLNAQLELPAAADSVVSVPVSAIIPVTTNITASSTAALAAVNAAEHVSANLSPSSQHELSSVPALVEHAATATTLDTGNAKGIVIAASPATEQAVAISQVADTKAPSAAAATAAVRSAGWTPPQTIDIFLPLLNADKTTVQLNKQNIALSSKAQTPAALLVEVAKSVTRTAYSSLGALDFFPEKLIVKRAWVENQTLMVDFNRAFEYSRYGRKALAVRLQLLLWSVFSANQNLQPAPIRFVSILIEGRRKTKIGGDGWVVNPFYSERDLKPAIGFLAAD